MKRYINLAAKEAGIHKNIGWHTFRHGFGTLLKANGDDVKAVQERLRDAKSRMTLDVYTPAMNFDKARVSEQGCSDDGAWRGPPVGAKQNQALTVTEA